MDIIGSIPFYNPFFLKLGPCLPQNTSASRRLHFTSSPVALRRRSKRTFFGSSAANMTWLKASSCGTWGDPKTRLI